MAEICDRGDLPLHESKNKIKDVEILGLDLTNKVIAMLVSFSNSVPSLNIAH